jgi:hypothetical protein
MSTLITRSRSFPHARCRLYTSNGPHPSTSQRDQEESRHTYPSTHAQTKKRHAAAPNTMHGQGSMERMGMPLEKQAVRPRILIVSRRHVRKNKLVDIVGEYQYVIVTYHTAFHSPLCRPFHPDRDCSPARSGSRDIGSNRI